VNADDVVAPVGPESRLQTYFATMANSWRGSDRRSSPRPASQSALTDLRLLQPVEPPSMRDFMVFEETHQPSWKRSGLTHGPDICRAARYGSSATPPT